MVGEKDMKLYLISANYFHDWIYNGGGGRSVRNVSSRWIPVTESNVNAKVSLGNKELVGRI